MLENVQALLETIDTLRSPGGCPWDRKQTLATAAHHLQDEAAEVLESALSGDLEHVREELGDLLFMVCFVTRILNEEFAVIAPGLLFLAQSRRAPYGSAFTIVALCHRSIHRAG